MSIPTTQPVPATEQLLDAVVAVASELDLPVVLQRIAEAARALVDATYGALGVLDETGEQLAEFLFVGMEPGRAEQIGPLPRGRGVLGELIRDPHPLRLDRLSDSPASFGFPPGHPPMRTFLGVPVRVRDQVFGNLYLTDSAVGRPSTSVTARWSRHSRPQPASRSATPGCTPRVAPGRAGSARPTRCRRRCSRLTSPSRCWPWSPGGPAS